MSEIKYSVIVPVYNRAEELRELLESLSKQAYPNFEVIILEDGSEKPSEKLVRNFKDSLNIQYIEKENTGQGFSRNEGAKLAQGEYLVFFDSDCIIPQNYFKIIDDFLKNNDTDAWGGPDKADKSFTILQKAISFSMTSFVTTGGIRGGKAHVGKFQPRTFNMGIKKKVFEEVGGFLKTNLGEDIELSSRLIKKGYATRLIYEAYVFHKRRSTLTEFFRQAKSFGNGRVYNFLNSNAELKLVHFFPLFFTVGIFLVPLLSIFNKPLFIVAEMMYAGYFLLILVVASIQYRNIITGFLSVITVLIQFSAYAIGFISGFISGKDK